MPGLNNVIRGLVLELAGSHGVSQVLGFRNGYAGLVGGGEPVPLTPALVAGIHNQGGTILGTSRGGQDTSEILATLTRLGISVLFVLGGDGTLRGARELADVAASRDVPLSVVGVPAPPGAAARARRRGGRRGGGPGPVRPGRYRPGPDLGHVSPLRYFGGR